MTTTKTSTVHDLYPEIVEWRRDFHQHAESGWVEFRTASLVASRLEEWGYEVKAGKEVVDEESRMGVPSESFLKEQEERALAQGADPKWLPYLSGGFTGVVGLLDTGKPGPTVGLRFDMDALDLKESSDASHVPVKEGFQSRNHNMMHACGHDAHTSIGLGLAKLLSENKNELTGKVKFIFQPAEEGVRGAKSMVAAGVVDDVEVFFASHIGVGIPLGQIVSGANGFLSTTKINVDYTGKAAHAGSNPEDGKNALLAASTAVLNLYGISRHSAGQSRINVGVFEAGTGRNIIPSSAHLKVETRGETTEINQYILKQALNIIYGAASMHDVEVKTDVVGEAKTSDSSSELKAYVEETVKDIEGVDSVISDSPFGSGSEDATYMLERVKDLGGYATYLIFGTTLAAGHHHEKFDIDESAMKIAVASLEKLVSHVEKFTLK
ncbi:M20 family metallo-hydrolase [Fictibacillus enclensis]|uniref:M20 family metallo-hydrolase n=1 Tax=Fictibacillus enclensis TaxID=1017270 RepID=UPI0025A2998B|nr:M20 family metallo-hydrolase [Fictibacillus enclensis]MDM5336440.1 M20 family metallo-hydrolase [Fictibacillus enclensis]